MSEPFIRARGLGKSFGRKSVLADVDLEVRPGEVVGVLGKNGAGKTTLLELILGFSRPTAGSVSLFGHESFALPSGAKSRVGFVPQQDELVNQLSGAAQLRLIGSFYRLWDTALLERLSAAWEIDLCERVRGMSLGQRQKLSILLALGHQPELLVLDEPVASLDPLARRQFLQQLIEIAADRRRAIVFSSHIVSDIERLATRIWIIKDGHLDWSGDIDELKQSVVRVHVRGTRAIPETLQIPQALSLERQGCCATAVVRGWTAQAAEQLERDSGARVDAEPPRPRGDFPGAPPVRTVARLLLIFHGATRLQRWLTVCGLVLIVIGSSDLIGRGLGPFGSYREFSTPLLALGIPLLLLGTLASMYLGLMMTRGIGWLDAACAVLTMTAIMAAAVYARGGRMDQELVIGLEALLAVLAVGFRALAMRRWRSLDWLMCRSERLARHAR